MNKDKILYPASIEIEHKDSSNKITTFFRLILAIPALTVLLLIYAKNFNLSIATALMILFRKKYPKWWYNYAFDYKKFSIRILAYILLLTDKYPSVEEEDTKIKLELKYPDVEKELNRWMPIFKFILVIPHLIILIMLYIITFAITIITWFYILITSKHPKPLFDFALGTLKYSFRAQAYFLLLVTDKYPPFTIR